MPASTLSSSREDDYASNRIAIVKIVSNIGRRGIPRCVVTGMAIILTSHRFSTFELKTTLPFPRGWSRSRSQNEILKVMELEVLRDVAPSLHSSPFYTVTADETTDSSNREPVAICFRWMDNSLNA